MKVIKNILNSNDIYKIFGVIVVLGLLVCLYCFRRKNFKKNLNDIPVLYINLDHRTDRKKNIENQLVGFNNIERISAIYTPNNGREGCTLSHIKALERAKQKGYEEFIIMEDDFEWIAKDKFIYPEIYFDVCMISGKINKKEFLSWDYNKVLDGRHTDCYLVKQEFNDKLINNFKEGYAKLKVENKHEYYIDVYWTKLQKLYTFITPSILIGRQIIDYSDIEKKVMKRY